MIVTFALIIVIKHITILYLLGMYDGSILDYLLNMDGAYLVYLFLKHDFDKIDKSKKYA